MVDDAAAVREYLIEGQKRALALPNRGPLRFKDNGDIHSDILEAYSTYGFYIFENALRSEELKDLENDLEAMRDNFPTEMGRSYRCKGSASPGGGYHGFYTAMGKTSF
jgi:hypothetical protein